MTRSLSLFAPFPALLLLVAAGCTTPSPPPSSTPNAEPAPSLEAPEYLLADLSPEGKASYQAILGAEVSPCEKPETLLACAEAKTCGECVYLSRIVFRLLRDKVGDDDQIANYLSQLAATRKHNAEFSASLSLEEAPVRGPKDASLQVIEIADFECPYCARLHKELKAIRAQLDQVTRFYFKNLPLQMHPNAEPAARAALAAGKQGKFWEYHDILFSRQDQIEPSRFSDWANELGLDVDRFLADYTSSSITSQVAKDREEVLGLGVRSTPVLILDGRPYLDRMNAEAIWDAVVFELARKGTLPLPEPPR